MISSFSKLTDVLTASFQNLFFKDEYETYLKCEYKVGCLGAYAGSTVRSNGIS